MVRSFVSAVAGLALLPALALAQQSAAPSSKPFQNTWFWGLKGGAMAFDPALGSVTKPTVGAEMLIVHERVGLYASVDQSFFDDELTGVFDPSAPGSVRAVHVGDWRRYNIGLYAFPVTWGSVRPYAGLGFALNVLQSASPEGNFPDEATQDSVYSRVDRLSSRASVAFTAGAQMQWGKLAVFGQAVAMPTRNNFLITGANNTYVIETGFRYAITNAIEKFTK
jgi:hypothetical protein